MSPLRSMNRQNNKLFSDAKKRQACLNLNSDFTTHKEEAATFTILTTINIHPLRPLADVLQFSTVNLNRNILYIVHIY